MVEERREKSDGNPATRCKLRVPLEYATPGSGYGVSWDLSPSGVRVEYASSPVEVGEEIALRFSLFAGSFGTEFIGRVVRRTENGFAVEFCALEPPQTELLRKALPSGAFDPPD